MPERATAFEIANWGKESAPGTPPSTGKRLGSLNVRPSYELDVTPYTVIGTKFPFTAQTTRDVATATIEGWPDFEGIVYPLSSVLVSTTPSQQGTSTAYKWTFNPSSSTADTPVTYTIQWGSSGGAQQFPYGLVTELTMEFSPGGNRVSGRMIGQKITDGATLWASPTVIQPVPVTPPMVSVYTGTSSPPTTKLTRAFSVSWTIRNRWSPVYVLDSAVSGWTTYVEQIPESEFTLLVEATASESDIWHTAASSNTARWLKIDAVGPIADSTYNYNISITSKVMVVGVREFTDHEGIIAVEWTLRSVWDTAGATAVKVEVVNKQQSI
ncbi:hypothetical protein [Thermogutta sp.]|uniref:hypothetical protein n=1 Tax=Thermogutta sp. TaxID=1962930 RepID=UPI00321FD1F2